MILTLNKSQASLLWLLVERAAPLPKDATVTHLRMVDEVVDVVEPLVGGKHPRAAAEELNAESRRSGSPELKCPEGWLLDYGLDDAAVDVTLAGSLLDFVKELWAGDGGKQLRQSMRTERWKRQVVFGFDAALINAKKE